nr:MAG TPA: Ellis van Creveld protein 2 like protein [Caudoviricetes sp.]
MPTYSFLFDFFFVTLIVNSCLLILFICLIYLI